MMSTPVPRTSSCVERKRSRAGLLVALMGFVSVLAGVMIPTSAGATTRPTHSETVLVADIKPLGNVLVTPKHFVLYEFARDKANLSRCTDSCAKSWPPYLLGRDDRLIVPKGLHGLSTIPRGRAKQVTMDSHPLYQFAGDRRAGQIRGQGIDDAWFAVDPAGHTVVEQSSPAAKTPTTLQGSSPVTPPTSSGVSGNSKGANSRPRPTPGPSGGSTANPATTPLPTAPAAVAPASPSPTTTPPVTTPPVTSPPVTTPPVTTPPTTTPVTTPPTTTPTTSGGGGGGGYGY